MNVGRVRTLQLRRCDGKSAFAIFWTEFPSTCRSYFNSHYATPTTCSSLFRRMILPFFPTRSTVQSTWLVQLFPLSNWHHPHNTPRNGSINIKTKLHQPHPDSSALLVLQASHDFALGPHHFSPWRRTGRPGQCSTHDMISRKSAKSDPILIVILVALVAKSQPWTQAMKRS